MSGLYVEETCLFYVSMNSTDRVSSIFLFFQCQQLFDVISSLIGLFIHLVCLRYSEYLLCNGLDLGSEQDYLCLEGYVL